MSTDLIGTDSVFASPVDAFMWAVDFAKFPTLCELSRTGWRAG